MSECHDRQWILNDLSGPGGAGRHGLGFRVFVDIVLVKIRVFPWRVPPNVNSFVCVVVAPRIFVIRSAAARDFKIFSPEMEPVGRAVLDAMRHDPKKRARRAILRARLHDRR